MTELGNPVSVPDRLKADTEETLRSICAESGRPITSSLLDIQKLAFSRERSLSWVSNLECLYLTGPMIGIFDRKRKRTSEVACPTTRYLGRRILASPFQKVARSFIAVSYTWMASIGEPMSKGAYSVETRIDGQHVPNEVRDAVLDRVIRYAGYVACQYLWIDQECIDQKNEREKEVAMQHMDLVYHYSDYPVAVLSAEVQSDEELAILARILNGDFVHGNSTSPSLRPNVDAQQNAPKALELLHRITSDSWWNRAWPYQEDYRAGKRMRLLIRYSNLENIRRENTKLFGELPGELIIISLDFRRELTRFCFAYKDILDKSTCETILQQANQYNVHRALSSGLTGMKPMYPLILRDIGSRGIEQCSDSLAIAANCCDYSVRISAEKLRKTEASLSISILALTLLNGEVLVSTEDKDSWSLDTKIFQFLEERSLVLHQMDRRQLTFQKSCRLDRVKLTSEGIYTTGHLWQLYKDIRISGSRGSSFKEDVGNRLTRHERSQLRRLAKLLDSGQEGMQYHELAKKLRLFTQRDKNSYDAQQTFAKRYMDLMARKIIDAMYSETQILCLGRLVDGFFGSECSSYTGIFVVEARHENPSYIFTSLSPAGDGLRQINKHVSLLVSPVGTQASYPPNMIARQWVSGLCFFSERTKIDVMFSWPKSFTV
jgi:hypothetical protein